MTTVAAPTDFPESISELPFPEEADRLLQDLISRNSQGQLAEAERREFAALAELSERWSLVRAPSMMLLQRAAP